MEVFTISDKATVSVTTEGDTTRLVWKGSIDADIANAKMKDFLDDLHERCKAQKIKALFADYTAMDFMFSSGIKNLICWIKEVTDDNLYTLTVIYNRNVRWQDISFDTIKVLIKNLILTPT